MTKVILMSIKSNQVDKIISGIKTWEFRRQPPKIDENDENIVIVYSSGRDKAIVGEFEIEKIVSTDLMDLLKIVGKKQDAETISAYKDFYEGKEKCSAIKIKNFSKYKQVITLENIRKIDERFCVPQNYRYLDKDSNLYKKIKELK